MRRFGFLIALLLCASSLHAQCLLRQSTAGQEVSIGPFLDTATGDTAQTGLTISNTDVRLKKGTANWAAKNSGGATHEEFGNYAITLDATDTATLGVLEIFVHEAGALAVWKTCFVETANEYDSKTGADVKQVDLLQWLGSTPNALISGRNDVTVGTVQTDGIPAAGLSAAAILKIQTGLFTIKKNTVKATYYFVLREANGDPYIGGTPGTPGPSNIACTRSLDGAAFAACAGSTAASIVHLNSGIYKATLAASDTNADDLVIRFAGPTCATVPNRCSAATITTQH